MSKKTKGSTIEGQFTEVNGQTQPTDFEQKLENANNNAGAMPPTKQEVTNAHAESKKGLISRALGAPGKAYNKFLNWAVKNPKKSQALLGVATVATFAGGAAAGYAMANSNSGGEGDVVDGEFTEIDASDTVAETVTDFDTTVE